MDDFLVSAFVLCFDEEVDKLVPISAHASDRKLYRLANKQRSVVAVIDQNEPEREAFRFLTRHFLEFQLPVAKIYHEDLSHGLLLVEDLGELTLLDVLLESRKRGEHFSGELEALYEAVLRALPRFQIEAGRSVDFTKCYPKPAFDRDSMLWDMHYFKSQYLSRCELSMDASLLERDFEVLADFLLAASGPWFMYRDFQARNIMVRDGQPYFIDYQGGRRGPLQYDVVSLLYQSRAALPGDARDRLREVYLEEAARHMDLNRDEFLMFYEGFVLIRLMQVLGTYGKLGLGEGKSYFMESIPFALKNLEQVLSLLRVPVALETLQGILHEVTKQVPIGYSQGEHC